jgi:cation diffusion facilitator family transporter
MCAIVIHIFGDFLGSIAVMISASITLICRIYVPGSDAYTQYIDPALSVIIALILFFPTLPLIYRCCTVLLQSVPSSINLEKLKKDVLAIESVKGIHELHVWSLANNQKIIGDIHVLVQDQFDAITFSGVYREVKKIFHKHKIHSSTIQLEFVSGSKYECNLLCSETCYEDWCCSPSLKEKKE